MKKIKNLLIILIFTILLTIPIKTKAISTEYTNINEKIETIEESGLSFENIAFKNWSNNQYPSVGISAIVSNTNNYEVSYKTITTLYDKNYNIILTINYFNFYYITYYTNKNKGYFN